MPGDNVTITLAFVAGFLSFISPCVLPLMPAYVSYMGARVTQQVAGELAVASGSFNGALPGKANRLGLLTHSLMFIAGFTLAFVGFTITIEIGLKLIGVSAYDVQNTVARVGGVIVIFFGLHVMGVTAWVLNRLRAYFGNVAQVAVVLDRVQGALFADTRRQINPRNPYGYAGSVFMGVVFAAGWTPCIGPIYGSILILASNGAISGAVVLMIAYSLGLGIPFLLTGLALDQVRGLIKRLQRHMRLIEVVSGVFLIVMGYLLASNQLAEIAGKFTWLSDFSYNIGECGTGIVRGDVPLSDLGICIKLGTNYNVPGVAG